jgi:hypothetical protein
MNAPRDCSHFIPVHTAELVELLCGERGLAEPDRAALREVAALMQMVYHQHFHPRLAAMKNAYAPFDPDSDATPVLPISAQQRQERLNGLLREVNWLLDRANFRHFDRTEMEQTLGHSSDFGIQMDVDFSAFEHVALFVRGESFQSRQLRSWRTLFQMAEVEIPTFRRLVLIMKLRDHPRLGPGADAEHVFLKLFKDVPRADADMLLPGARVKLKVLDRGKIGVGLLSGIGTMGYRMAHELGGLLQGVMLSDTTLWGLTAGLAGYGYKSYYDYQQTRQAYHLSLTQSLYFQNLDSNAGVLTRLFDEAEEQEMRTTLLAYYVLWRYGGESGLTEEELESLIDLFLDRRAGVVTLCEQGEPLRKLARLGLVESVAGRHSAPPLPWALEQLRTLRDRRAPLPPRPPAQSRPAV